MATRTVIDTRRSVVLPDGADVVKIAAAMNPAMSAWVALRRRVPIQPGQTVLVLGATGNAGSMAIQVAKRLGAGRVVAAGRDQARLTTVPGIGADASVPLTDDDEPPRRRWPRQPARSTWSSTTCGVSPPVRRSWRCCRPAPTAAVP